MFWRRNLATQAGARFQIAKLSPSRDLLELVLMIDPVLASSIAGKTCFVINIVPRVLMRKARSQMAASIRSEEHTSELQSLMRISYAVFCLKKKIQYQHRNNRTSILIYQTTNKHTKPR